jgi:Lrp/AsnC family transcriptional regulator, leucine-responsive regulatory protein
MKIDDLDIQILNELQDNGRITNRELAQKLGISASPTLERVKKLEQNGVIKKYATLVDPASVGIGIFTFVQVTLARHGKASVENFMDNVKDVDAILECYHTTGHADFLLKVGVKDIQAYEHFILHTLTELPDVQYLETMVVMSTIKNNSKLPISRKD